MKFAAPNVCKDLHELFAAYIKPALDVMTEKVDRELVGEANTLRDACVLSHITGKAIKVRQS